MRAKSETMRRLRLGDVQKVLRWRYGPELPDDDAGRDDLHELFLPGSLGQGDWRKMKNAIEIWAPWMDAGEALEFINRETARQTTCESQVQACWAKSCAF